VHHRLNSRRGPGASDTATAAGLAANQDPQLSAEAQHELDMAAAVMDAASRRLAAPYSDSIARSRLAAAEVPVLRSIAGVVTACIAGQGVLGQVLALCAAGAQTAGGLSLQQSEIEEVAPDLAPSLRGAARAHTEQAQ